MITSHRMTSHRIAWHHRSTTHPTCSRQTSSVPLTTSAAQPLSATAWSTSPCISITMCCGDSCWRRGACMIASHTNKLHDVNFGSCLTRLLCHNHPSIKSFLEIKPYVLPQGRSHSASAASGCPGACTHCSAAGGC